MGAISYRRLRQAVILLLTAGMLWATTQMAVARPPDIYGPGFGFGPIIRFVGEPKVFCCVPRFMASRPAARSASINISPSATFLAATDKPGGGDGVIRPNDTDAPLRPTWCSAALNCAAYSTRSGSLLEAITEIGILWPHNTARNLSVCSLLRDRQANWAFKRSVSRWALAASASKPAVISPTSTLYRANSSARSAASLSCNVITTRMVKKIAIAANAASPSASHISVFQAARSKPSIRLTPLEVAVLSICGASLISILQFMGWIIGRYVRGKNAKRPE